MFTPWLFQHPGIFFSSEKSDEPLGLDKLIQRLNYIHFHDGHVFFILDQRATNTQIVIRAYPQFCEGHELICQLDPADAAINLKTYTLTHMLIDDGLSVILSSVKPLSFEGCTLRIHLPETSHVKTIRKVKRYLCQDIQCKIIQGDFVASGKMIDFSAGGLGIDISDHVSSGEFDEHKPALLNIFAQGVSLYSGMCRLIHNRLNTYDNKLVFVPISQQSPLHPKRELRTPRKKISNLFTVRFTHPFFKSHIERDIVDISSSGFAIQDALEDDILLSGLFIPELDIVYAGNIKIKCSARVVYRQTDPKAGLVKYGLAIVDMTFEDYTRLSQILGIAHDAHTGIAYDVDRESLWEFLFETGFIGEQSFDPIHNDQKTLFKEAFQKLYNDHQDIARHILYKRNGRIYGHVAMIRAYEPSWLIHHYAARHINSRLQILTFLKHVIQYLGPYQRMHSAGTTHFMAYYRPNLDLVERLFDHFTKHVADPKKCSVDRFASLTLNKTEAKRLPEGWVMRDCSIRDLTVLKNFYEPASGGLLLNALGIDIPSDKLKKAFAQAGFTREYRLYCLCYLNRPLAFFLMNQSDIRFNLAPFLNGIKIIIIEPDILSWAMLAAAVNQLGVFYEDTTIPLLIYPAYFLPLQNIAMEKQYALWILHADAADDWLSYSSRLTSIRTDRR
jgi:hypothetical protein